MKVTDEMVEAAIGEWALHTGVEAVPFQMRAALEAALAAAPQAEPDHDVQALRQALWDVFAELGGDTDGNPTPESVTHGLISSAVTLARKHRQRRDALLDERDALREAARMALEAADSVVSQLSALHRATMGYEDACVLRGAELVADALREALGDEK